jgi:hypothetical protein
MLLVAFIAVVLAACMSGGSSPDVAREPGTAPSMTSTSEPCEPEELEGVIVDDCVPNNEVIVRGLVESLEQVYPGRYTPEEVECIGDNDLSLSEANRASMASAVFNRASPASGRADAAIEGLFTSCGTTGPPTS